jgi:hypothetical protein
MAPVFGLVHLYVQHSFGLWWGAAGGGAHALGQYLGDCQDGFSEKRHWGPYLAWIALGALIGAAILALGHSAAFVAGLAGPDALVALGATFNRRPGGGQE